MKKIEEEFLKEFNESLENQKSFEDIKDKINMERFEKKGISIRFSFKKFGVVGACLLLFAVALPTAINMWNAHNQTVIGNGTHLTSTYIPSDGSNNHSSITVDQSSGETQAISPVEGTPSTPSTANTEDNTIKTVINTSAPSLPHHLAAEVDKRVSIEADYIDINVFVGHPKFIEEAEEITFPEFTLTKQELENYKFSLMLNYNSELPCVSIDNLDYLNSDYNITFSDNNGIETINFHKSHNISLLKEKMINVDYGFVKVEFYLMPLMPSIPDEKYLITDTTLYYSVTKTEIVFGLSQNPIAHEGDEGVITNGWSYQE